LRGQVGFQEAIAEHPVKGAVGVMAHVYSQVMQLQALPLSDKGKRSANHVLEPGAVT
jgi:hypothetical protein